ncbi:MAG: GerMN domain-containing protein [Deferrisomatales bacterium]|nr:GerMN domain-containing protein [Deferrisomatales bacterium]
MARDQLRKDAPAARAAARRRTRPRGRARRRWVAWGAVLLALLVAGGVLVQRLGLPDRHGVLPVALPGLTAPGGREVTLYFADPRWTQLVPESRRLPAGLDAVRSLGALVEALAEGPREEGRAAVLPRAARLRGAYLGPDGLAVIDFEAELAAYAPGGASGELLTVYGVVHTLCENVPGVRSVLILLGGEARETLAGHVKLSEPLAPDPQWVRERP